MASLYTALSAIQAQISSVTQGLISNSPDTFGKPITVEVGLYWPSAKSLQNNVRPGNAPGGGGPSALISIVDRGIAADSTRWTPSVVAQTAIQPTMTVAASEAYVQQLASTTLTFGGPVSPGDAVGVVLSAIFGGNVGFVPIAGANATPSTMAAQLVALINADPVATTWLTAVAAGPVVTLTSLLSDEPIAMRINVGNNGTRTTEIARRKRHFQIVLWCRTPDDRITVGDPIEVLIAGLEADFGLTFPDGTMGRLTFTGDTQIEAAILSDTLRRDFMVCVDYGITTTDQTFAILAPISRTTTF